MENLVGFTASIILLSKTRSRFKYDLILGKYELRLKKLNHL